MISRQLLRYVVAVEVMTALVFLAAVVAHSLWLWRRQRSDAPRLIRGSATLSAAIVGELDEDRLGELRRLPARVQRQVVEHLAVGLGGEEGRRVGCMAQELGLVASAQRRCRSRWWWRRLLGTRQLNVYGSGGDMLPRMFDDPNPAVRAAVIEWVGDAQREDLARSLVSSLQDPSTLCRYAAADSILRAGAPLVATVARELASRSGQEQADLLTVLARRPDSRYRRVALEAATGDLPALRAAAAALLGGVGGPGAGTTLQSLLNDPDAATRAAAATALGRLGYQQVVPDLAPLLRDPSFSVRRAAGGALAVLGPGGILLLRHYLSDTDRFAADMAHYSLDAATLRASGTEAVRR